MTVVSSDAFSAAEKLAERQQIMDIYCLVVEDDEFQRTNLSLLFESANKQSTSVQFALTVVDSPRSALVLLNGPKAPPRVDLILLDVRPRHAALPLPSTEISPTHTHHVPS